MSLMPVAAGPSLPVSADQYSKSLLVLGGNTSFDLTLSTTQQKQSGNGVQIRGTFTKLHQMRAESSVSECLGTTCAADTDP